jgi:hypothetical protein
MSLNHEISLREWISHCFHSLMSKIMQLCKRLIVVEDTSTCEKEKVCLTSMEILLKGLAKNNREELTLSCVQDQTVVECTSVTLTLLFKSA